LHEVLTDLKKENVKAMLKKGWDDPGRCQPVSHYIPKEKLIKHGLGKWKMRWTENC